MPSILAVTVPFFALVLIGYLAAWRGLLPESAIPGLNVYVLFFALPCMLFRFGASQPFARLLEPALLAVYVTSALVIVALTFASTRRRRVHGAGVATRDAAFGALVAAFPNSGFMGVPLIVALLGSAASGPVIGTLLIDLVLTSTLCLALAQLREDQPADALEASIERSIWRSLRGAAANPLPWAIALGAAVAASGVALPVSLAQIVGMLGDSATPVALFTIGTVLWRAGRHAHAITPPRRYVPIALVKLFVHPLLVFAIGHVALRWGAPITRFGLTALVLAAALPSASSVSLLAERYGADNGRVARIIMTSTVLAFATFPLLAWLLQNARPPR